MSSITLKVNGNRHTVDVEPVTPLLYILRNDLGLQGPRFGCGLGQCGACTVIIGGAAVRSCILPVSSVKGEITTLEGLSSYGKERPRSHEESSAGAAVDQRRNGAKNHCVSEGAQKRVSRSEARNFTSTDTREL
jgi:succinate dehydrogenase/fumarate reductase-like Fe-S protein